MKCFADNLIIYALIADADPAVHYDEIRALPEEVRRDAIRDAIYAAQKVLESAGIITIEKDSHLYNFLSGIELTNDYQPACSGVKKMLFVSREKFTAFPLDGKMCGPHSDKKPLYDARDAIYGVCDLASKAFDDEIKSAREEEDDGADS